MAEVWLALGPAPTGGQVFVAYILWSDIWEGPDGISFQGEGRASLSLLSQ